VACRAPANDDLGGLQSHTAAAAAAIQLAYRQISPAGASVLLQWSAAAQLTGSAAGQVRQDCLGELIPGAGKYRRDGFSTTL